MRGGRFRGRWEGMWHTREGQLWQEHASSLAREGGEEEEGRWVVAREDLESFLGPQFCSILSMERMDSLSMTMRDSKTH